MKNDKTKWTVGGLALAVSLAGLSLVDAGCSKRHREDGSRAGSGSSHRSAAEHNCGASSCGSETKEGAEHTCGAADCGSK